MKEEENKTILKIKKQGESDPLILAIIIFGSAFKHKYYRDIDIAIIYYPKLNETDVYNNFLKFSGSFTDKYDENKLHSINKIVQMKGFRNILVHKYGEIEETKVFSFANNNKKDFIEFIEEIKLILKKL